MSDVIQFKTEVEISGTPEEVSEILQAMTNLKVRTKSKITFRPLGGIRMYPELKAALEAAQGHTARSQATTMKLPDNIAGGIRAPHVHVGNEAILLPPKDMSTILTDLVGSRINTLMESTDFPTVAAQVDKMLATKMK